MKLNSQLENVAMLMAIPLILNGYISDIINQAMGPRLIAKKAM